MTVDIQTTFGDLEFVPFSVLFWSEEVYAEPENDVKRGAFPFMASALLIPLNN